MEKSIQAPKKLHLKIGAHVVLVTNLNVEAGLVNGATGVVVAFDKDPNDRVSPDNTYPVVAFSVSEYAQNSNGGMQMHSKVEEIMVKYHSFRVMQGDEELSCREQIPLNLVRT